MFSAFFLITLATVSIKLMKNQTSASNADVFIEQMSGTEWINAYTMQTLHFLHKYINKLPIDNKIDFHFPKHFLRSAGNCPC